MNLLAQVPDWGAPLANLGVAGAVIGWFMFVVTPILKDIARAQDYTSRAVLLLTIGMEEAGTETKRQARELLAKLEAKELARKKDS